MIHLFKENRFGSDAVTSITETCFNVEASSPLSKEELSLLKRVLADGFVESSVFEVSKLSEHKNNHIIELGPRMNFATAFNTNVLQILFIVLIV